MRIVGAAARSRAAVGYAVGGAGTFLEICGEFVGKRPGVIMAGLTDREWRMSEEGLVSPVRGMANLVPRN
jgi:hypothetical protein